MAVEYHFGEFRLDPQRRSLADQAGACIPLAPRAFDALLVLVRQPGRLVTKAALMKAVWPTVVVSDNSLDQVVSRLRRALAEHGGAASSITTERGRGYRFSADVRVVQGAGPFEGTPRPGNGRETAEQAQAKRLHAQAVTLSTRPSSDNLAGAFGLLHTALALDPAHAPALAYRALLTTVCIAFDVPIAGGPADAERDARRALDIDPAIAQGHHALANVAAARGDWNEADRHYEAAARFEPEPHARASHIYQVRHAVGHLHGAQEEAESIDHLSSSQPLGIVAAALSALLLGRDADALLHADRACALGWPRTHPVLHEIYFGLAVRACRFEEAAQSTVATLSKPMRAAGGAEAVNHLCGALAKREPRASAVAALRGLLLRIPPDDLGIVDRRRLLLWLTLLGALDDAFAFADASLTRLERSDTVGLLCARGALWLPEMSPFRRDARFQGLVERLRFADYWERHGGPDAYTPGGLRTLAADASPMAPKSVGLERARRAALTER